MTEDEFEEVREITPVSRNGSAPPGFVPAVEALPGLARVAAAACWHSTEWGVRTTARAGRRVMRAVSDPVEAAALARDATEAASVIGGLARAVSSGVPLARALTSAGESLGELAEPPEYDSGADRHDGLTLRERGAELLERSRDVWDDDVAHPAYERILEELAPDEARILVLLLQGGPQPSVDVRTGGPVGMVHSQLVAPGMSMIGGRAGCRHLDQVPSYLNNLFRLGLVWFSREALRDPMEYQVVEAQPDVLAAMHSVKFSKVVRRSIHLTPFGEDFCRTCLVDEDPDSGTSFPPHGMPPEADPGESPVVGLARPACRDRLGVDLERERLHDLRLGGAGHLVQVRDDVLHRDALLDEAHGSALQGRLGHLAVALGREHDHLGLRAVLPEQRQEVEAGHLGQVDVEQDDARPVVLRHRERLPGVAGGADDLDVGAGEGDPEQPSHVLVVVDDQHAQRAGLARSAAPARVTRDRCRRQLGR